MIQIYTPGNEEYSKNGNMVLLPTSATVRPQLNSAWEVEMTHPLDEEGRWKYIVDEAVIKMPSFNGEQLFRITKKKKQDSGINATMQPIFMDAKKDCFILNRHVTNKTGQEALNIMLSSNTKYSAESDIAKMATAYYETENFIAALNSDADNSFINRWGGEIEFDNFKVKVNQRIGHNRGLRILYGKNIKQNGFTEEVDYSSVITRIIPKSYNGYMIERDEPWVDSPLIDTYQNISYAVIKFEDVKMAEDAQEDDEENGITICRTQEELEAALIKKCNEQFGAGVDKPKVNISVDLELLDGTDLYEDVKELEKASFGDTVYCEHSILKVATQARVIDLTYDSVRERVESVKLGDFKYNFFDNVSSMVNRVESAIREDGTVVGQQVSGIINGVKAQLRAMSTVAKKSSVKAVLFEDRDPESETYGAMALGTMGFMIAGERLEDNSDWDWRTFGTGKGFFADFITTGTMLADRIKGGTLTIGGLDNKDGVIVVTDEDGNEIGRWSADGIISDFSANNRRVRINKGAIYIETGKGEVVGTIWCVSNDIMRIDVGDSSVLIADDFINLISKEIEANGYPGTTGTAEFSNGTYLKFQNGILISGNTAEGGF